jgi:hypothetical protein
LREFGFNPKEDVVGEFSARGVSEEEDLDTFNKIDRRNGSTGGIITEVISEFEKEAIAKLTKDEWLELHLK